MGGKRKGFINVKVAESKVTYKSNLIAKVIDL